MHFAAPWFLTLLIPLIGVAVWLMSRRGESAEVPFVHLWPRDTAPMGRAWRFGRLPLWIALLLFSAAAAILSAADLRIGSRIERPVTLIVDRGVNMSAIDRDGRNVLQQILGEIEPYAIAPKRIIPVPPTDDLSIENWRSEITSLKISAIDSSKMLNASIEAALRGSDLPILLLTNQSAANKERVIAGPFSPSGFNAAISHIAAGDGQVMVRVMGTESRPVRLRVRSGDLTVDRELSLAADQSQEVFIDLSLKGESISAEIVEPDAIAADNFAWLVRGASSPTIEVRPGAPVAMSRMAAVYAKHREADRNSIVAVTSDAAEKNAAVVIAGASETLSDITGPIEITQEIGRQIDWPAALRGARIGGEPDQSWRPLVRVGGRTVLAQRDAGARQVLINFWSEEFAQTPAFVVLMTDVFDSFATTSSAWSSEPMRKPPADWKRSTPALDGYEDSPGVYRDSAGRLRALNALAVFPRGTQRSKSEIERIPTQLAQGRSSAAVFALIALMLLAAGVVMMRRPMAKRHSINIASP